MVQINFAKREINCKLVYYGPGLSGKTTNLEVVHKKAPASKKGELTSIATEGDRTLFFDYMPLELGKVGGMNTKFQLYTVPGQVYYNATRKLVLQGADGVVFVADSQPEKMDENLESFANLEENLREQGLDPKTIPMVLQWNKRDLPSALPPEELDKIMNKYGAPTFEAVAVTGEGVFPTLKKLAQMVLEKLNKEYGLDASKDKGGGAAKAAPAKPAAAAKPEPKPEPAAAPEPKPEPAAARPEPKPEPAAPRRADPEPARAARTASGESKSTSGAEPRSFNVVTAGGGGGGGGNEGGGAGKIVGILVVLLIVAALGFVGAGYAAKLPAAAQKVYDDNLKASIGGGTPSAPGGVGGATPPADGGATPPAGEAQDGGTGDSGSNNGSSGQ